MKKKPAARTGVWLQPPPGLSLGLPVIHCQEFDLLSELADLLPEILALRCEPLHRPFESPYGSVDITTGSQTPHELLAVHGP